jgi:hypothetical protein
VFAALSFIQYSRIHEK